MLRRQSGLNRSTDASSRSRSTTASRSATSSALRWCFVSHRFFSQLCNVIFGAHEHDLRSVEHTADEGARFRQLFGAVDRWIDLSPQALLNRSKCGEQVRQL